MPAPPGHFQPPTRPPPAPAPAEPHPVGTRTQQMHPIDGWYEDPDGPDPRHRPHPRRTGDGPAPSGPNSVPTTPPPPPPPSPPPPPQGKRAPPQAAPPPRPQQT